MIYEKAAVVTEKILSGDKEALSLEDAVHLAGLPEDCTFDLLYCLIRSLTARQAVA